MNRLTEKDEQGNWSLKGVKWEQLHEGATITGELWRKLYGALWKLMEYEDTGMDPDDVIRLNDFNQCSTGQAIKELAKERAKHRWIQPGERLPDQNETVLVTVKRHRWVADYDCDWVPENEKTEHKEVVYVTCGRLDCIRWKYMDFESGVWEEALYTNVLLGVLLDEPIAEIIAWQPLPEPYKEGQSWTD